MTPAETSQSSSEAATAAVDAPPSVLLGTWIALQGSSWPTRLVLAAEGDRATYERQRCADFTCRVVVGTIEHGTFTARASSSSLVLRPDEARVDGDPRDFLWIVLDDGTLILEEDALLSLGGTGSGPSSSVHFRLQRAPDPAVGPKGEPCGMSVCAAGTTCCNPLEGTCVPPGFVCAF
jgi:hypothetical protein